MRHSKTRCLFQRHVTFGDCFYSRRVYSYARVIWKIFYLICNDIAAESNVIAYIFISRRNRITIARRTRAIKREYAKAETSNIPPLFAKLTHDTFTRAVIWWREDRSGSEDAVLVCTVLYVSRRRSRAIIEWQNRYRGKVSERRRRKNYEQVASYDDFLTRWYSASTTLTVKSFSRFSVTRPPRAPSLRRRN